MTSSLEAIALTSSWVLAVWAIMVIAISALGAVLTFIGVFVTRTNNRGKEQC